jgi:hypothetical protein
MWSLLMLVFLVIAVAVGVGMVQVPEGLHWKQSGRAAKVWIAKAW